MDDVSEYKVELFERLLRSHTFDGAKHYILYHFHEELEDSDSFLTDFFKQFLSPKDFEECFALLQAMKTEKNYRGHKGYTKHDPLDAAFENFSPL